MRLLIVSSVPGPGYAGMDRPLLGAGDDAPEDLVLRAAALEDLPVDQQLAAHLAFLDELRAGGVTGYELIALGAAPDATWDLLGFDVGETTRRAWSALAHRDELGLPAPALTEHGLFADRAEAEAFLASYLAADDPDASWTPDGWQARPDLYAVVPIYRLAR